MYTLLYVCAVHSRFKFIFLFNIYNIRTSSFNVNALQVCYSTFSFDMLLTQFFFYRHFCLFRSNNHTLMDVFSYSTLLLVYVYIYRNTFWCAPIFYIYHTYTYNMCIRFDSKLEVIWICLGDLFLKHLGINCIMCNTSIAAYFILW